MEITFSLAASCIEISIFQMPGVVTLFVVMFPVLFGTDRSPLCVIVSSMLLDIISFAFWLVGLQYGDGVGKWYVLAPECNRRLVLPLFFFSGS